MSATPGRAMVKIATGAVVCSECELRGDITIGSRTVIHPKARVIADAGPIIIGEGNLIEERAEIINSWATASDEFQDEVISNPGVKVMNIGNNNVFEVGSRCECSQIGDNNVLECKAVLGSQTELGNGCIIGSKCHLSSEDVLPDNTVIYGSRCERRVQLERPPFEILGEVGCKNDFSNPVMAVGISLGLYHSITAQALQLDFLTKILPNYHHLKKPNVSGGGTRTPNK